MVRDFTTESLSHDPIHGYIPFISRVGLPSDEAAEQDLIVTVRVADELVMVELHQKRNPVRVLARHTSQHSECGGHGVAPPLHRQLHNVLGVEICRIRRETRTRRMLDALVHRQARQVTRPREAPRVEIDCRLRSTCGLRFDGA